jgi:fumarate hydratase class II
MRMERDTLGEIEVAEDRLWGAQTQRSLEFFCIGRERFSRETIAALGMIKRAAAVVHHELGLLDDERKTLICRACAEVESGQLAEHFPLVIWQTGSGTQTNMNVCEVIANRANQLAGKALGGKAPVHPNDHVNMGQSSNDVFPTAMHLATLVVWQERLRPALASLQGELGRKVEAFADIVKLGRTHLMDATPLTLGQEFSGYLAQFRFAEGELSRAEQSLTALALGGTAVGTGLNTHPQFAERVCALLAEWTGFPLHRAENAFMALAGHEAMLAASGALRMMAQAAMKMAGDIRLMGSGPRAGLAELILPANEPGSSIMPGKVNPTQCEALTMVAVRVLGNDTATAIAASSGHFELNVYKPLILHCVLESSELLADALNSFTRHCLAGLQPNLPRLEELLQRSLMLVTALNPLIGYDRAALIAKTAHAEGKTLREAALELGFLDGASFDAAMDPRLMLKPQAP